MKKIIIALLVLFAFFGCSKDDPKEYYSFENRTKYKVKVKPTEKFLNGSPSFELLINPNETKTHESEYRYDIFDVTSTETNKLFDYNFSGDLWVITLLIPAVIYKVTGSATSVDITYSTSNGTTQQKTINLPYEIEYSYFSNDFKYISAQNNSSFGSVRVELFIKNSLISQGFCDGGYCISTAHN
jgi:hypothetical protein